MVKIKYLFNVRLRNWINWERFWKSNSTATMFGSSFPRGGMRQNRDSLLYVVPFPVIHRAFLRMAEPVTHWQDKHSNLLGKIFSEIIWKLFKYFKKIQNIVYLTNTSHLSWFLNLQQANHCITMHNNTMPHNNVGMVKQRWTKAKHRQRYALTHFRGKQKHLTTKRREESRISSSLTTMYTTWLMSLNQSQTQQDSSALIRHGGDRHCIWERCCSA